MKNRSKELGLYSVLGMEKKHLLIMTLWELLFFYVLTVGVGLGLGLLFDRLIFALLLKCMGLPVVIQSTFQIDAVLNTLLGLAFSFWPHSLVEFFPPLALQFPPPYAAKKRERRRDASCWFKLC